MEGRTLGSYTIERELGRGGMGAVYTAVHTLLGRRAAVKVLLAELSRDQELVARFFNEARAATAIKHPSIVEVYDFGWSSDGSAYIVMELMEGEPLSARRARLGRLPVAAAITIARQIANALAAAHKAGIVHRDLKPDNVFLVSDIEVAGGERVKLLDFGIAKLALEGAASRTSTGAILGTPLYMSPEQCEGSRKVDHRTDLYALGCILFEMLGGRPPFQSEGIGGLIGMHLYVAPPSLRSVAPDAPAELDALVARLLAKSPDERPATADEVAATLARIGTSSSQAAVAAPVTAPSPIAAPAAPPVGAAPSSPPTTLSGSSSARPSIADAPSSSRRRGRGLVIGGAVLVAGLAAVIAAVASGGGAGEGASPALDAAVIADVATDAAALPAIDAQDPADAALAEMIDANNRRDFKTLRAALDRVYDATTDGDPRRARADELIAGARALVIATVRGEIEGHNHRGRCEDARQRAEETIVDWGDDALVLRKLARGCSTARGGGSGVPIDAGVPPGRELTGTEIAVLVRKQSGRLRPCVTGGNVRSILDLKVAPDGRVTQAVVDGVEPEVATCLTRALRTLKFPTSVSGGAVRFPLPLEAVPVRKPPATTGPLEDPLAPALPPPGAY